MARQLLAVTVVIVVLAVGASAAGVFDGGSQAYRDYGYGRAAGTGAPGWLVGALVAVGFSALFGMLALGVYIGLSQAKTWFMAGAEAAQRGREIDERVDAQKTAALASLARTAITLGARSGPADAPIVTPLDAQGAWLPELEEYHRPPALPAPDPDVWDVELPA